MKVLWLASTYPSKIHPYDGDFVKRHAQAVSRFCAIELIHVIKDPNGMVTNKVSAERVVSGQLIERIIYYKPVKTSVKILDRIISGLQYRRIYRKAVARYLSENNDTKFIHVHIAMKAGLTALWAKRKYKLPYILSEHWGGYLPEARPNITHYNFVYRYLWEKIITEAGTCTFVSGYFKNFMEARYKIKNSPVIPNVVNTGIFFPGEKQPADKIRFAHISTMIYQKNPEAILQAFGLLKDKFAFEVFMFGPVNPYLYKLINELELQKQVFIKGERPQEELAAALQQADALILYSRFETFGCVLIEANACGVPVIVSNLPVFQEIVEQGVNAIFVEGENPGLLAEALQCFVEQKDSFNKPAIAAAAAEKYNYNKVGQQFIDLYKNFSTDLN